MEYAGILDFGEGEFFGEEANACEVLAQVVREKSEAIFEQGLKGEVSRGDIVGDDLALSAECVFFEGEGGVGLCAKGEGVG